MNADQRWKLAVMEADDWTCQNCGTPKHLDAHHIEPKSRRPDLRHDPANGVTLCRNCHTWYHQCPEMWQTFVERWRNSPHTPLCGEHAAEAPQDRRLSRRNASRQPLFTQAWLEEYQRRHP